MKIYFMGICGTAMGNAALLARAAGHEVLGADTGVYPPMSTVLAQAGIALHEGYAPARLQQLAPDLVVIGNAMSRGNPEVEWLLDTRALPFTSLPALLHDSILRHRRNLVICGTHGKTTTTALTAYLLRAAGRDPGFLIGGVPQDPPVGAHLGAAVDPFVIEGDEYDSAFFDKRSKFIHYAPRIAVLNNLEFDHADIFRDVADIQRTFSHLVRIVPRNGCVVMNGDDPNLRALGPIPWTRVVRVGLGEECDVRIVDFNESSAGASFALRWRGEPWGAVRWSLPGIFNARNAAMAATAAGLALAPAEAGAPAGAVGAKPTALALDALPRFRGVRRRQEILWQSDALTVVEDFGHHPTALAETLRSLRARFPGCTLTAAFEPRSNTARTKALQPAFQEALALADEVYLGAVSRADKLAPGERFDPAEVATVLRQRGRTACFAATNAALADQLVANALGAGATDCRRLVVFFSNGSFDGIIGRFVAAAKGTATRS
ncbi:UDP-N-acetylmuramate:L-alanyl-gamma-D-glutamyl-meso-diaminopimelate ligase [Opitutus sp. ER46]|uniref:UDP-N-acetylmuramate:L-alanyl-gamma-D-glutamyl- meso-diaminopimelate ligase n=1 Tax=Opitutus sp. ER46 TaxID=2161864 RepID=UPI000D310C3E|nr:UDP-N-acetylmuramate:L-alanyl-gamma-D-glutamyl-meso-diaminopimelate ligase [Opitutus sp. ER46]PTX91313.1 UDP-N-acetylmuramate:L-alanyl-gamma-D-glutamyl-meso-diaminopimelate ligase [Opitutus sp. ER46]